MRKIKILWTDDEVEALKPHIFFLEEKGYEIDTCSNGNDTIDLVRQNRYDLIFLDAYNGFSIYQYMLTKEAFAEMADCLSPGGILTVNTVGKLSIEGTHGMIYDRLTMAVVKTLSSVFKNTAVKADSDGICNFVYYASAAPFIKPAGDIDVVQVTDGELITDDRNCVDNITSGVIEKWRKQEMKNAGRIFLF